MSDLDILTAIQETIELYRRQASMPAPQAELFLPDWITPADAESCRSYVEQIAAWHGLRTPVIFRWFDGRLNAGTGTTVLSHPDQEDEVMALADQMERNPVEESLEAHLAWEKSLVEHGSGDTGGATENPLYGGTPGEPTEDPRQSKIGDSRDPEAARQRADQEAAAAKVAQKANKAKNETAAGGRKSKADKDV